jgi:hypothetical protein
MKVKQPHQHVNHTNRKAAFRRQKNSGPQGAVLLHLKTRNKKWVRKYYTAPYPRHRTLQPAIEKRTREQYTSFSSAAQRFVVENT